MAKSKIIYEDRPTVYAKFNHPQSQDYIEYKSIIQITNSGKQPITIQLDKWLRVIIGTGISPNGMCQWLWDTKLVYLVSNCCVFAGWGSPES